MCPGLVACLNSQPLSHNLGLTKPYRPPQSVTSDKDCTTETSLSADTYQVTTVSKPSPAPPSQRTNWSQQQGWEPIVH